MSYLIVNLPEGLHGIAFEEQDNKLLKESCGLTSVEITEQKLVLKGSDDARAKAKNLIPVHFRLL